MLEDMIETVFSRKKWLLIQFEKNKTREYIDIMEWTKEADGMTADERYIYNNNGIAVYLSDKRWIVSREEWEREHYKD